MLNQLKQYSEAEIKELGEDKFCKDRDNNIFPYLKSDLIQIIDPYNPDTFIPILQALDIPFFAEEWLKYIEHYPGKCPLLRYISLMKLKGYQYYRFKDTYLMMIIRKQRDKAAREKQNVSS